MWGVRWPPRTWKRRESWRRSGQCWGGSPSYPRGIARPPAKTSSGKPSPRASAAQPGPAGPPTCKRPPLPSAAPSPELPSFSSPPLRIKHGASGTCLCLSAPRRAGPGWCGESAAPPGKTGGPSRVGAVGSLWRRWWPSCGAAMVSGGHFGKGLHSSQGCGVGLRFSPLPGGAAP